MKRTVRATIEKEFEIDIPDHFLTDEYISQFESYIGVIDDEDKKDGMFKHVAYCAANDCNEAEGIGYIGSAHMQTRAESPEDFIVYDEAYYDFEAEIM